MAFNVSPDGMIHLPMNTMLVMLVGSYELGYADGADMKPKKDPAQLAASMSAQAAEHLTPEQQVAAMNLAHAQHANLNKHVHIIRRQQEGGSQS